MRIGLVNVSQFVGGAEREVLDHATALRDDYAISVVAIIDTRNAEFAAMLGRREITVESADFYIERRQGAASGNFGNLWRLWRQARTLRAIERKHKLDLLVTYSFHSGSVGAVARLSGLKAKLVIGQVTRRDLTRGGLMERLQFFAADAVTYNSSAMRASFAQVARRYSRQEKVVYSYVKKPGPQDTRKERDRLLARRGLSSETIVVGFCGHIFEGKRVTDVVEAVGLLNAAAPGKFFLAAIGGSSDPSEYETHVRALAGSKCPGRHWFFPFASDPFPLMAACDVLVVPSIEPFGRVLVEAMYLGIPFVATDVSGPKEIMALADARCGKLVPPARPDLIAEAITEVIKNRPDERPPVPRPLTREGIIGGAVQFYRDVLEAKAKGRIIDFEGARHDYAGANRNRGSAT